MVGAAGRMACIKRLKPRGRAGRAENVARTITLQNFPAIRKTGGHVRHVTEARFDKIYNRRSAIPKNIEYKAQTD